MRRVGTVPGGFGDTERVQRLVEQTVAEIGDEALAGGLVDILRTEGWREPVMCALELVASPPTVSALRALVKDRSALPVARTCAAVVLGHLGRLVPPTHLDDLDLLDLGPQVPNLYHWFLVCLQRAADQPAPVRAVALADALDDAVGFCADDRRGDYLARFMETCDKVGERHIADYFWAAVEFDRDESVRHLCRAGLRAAARIGLEPDTEMVAATYRWHLEDAFIAGAHDDPECWLSILARQQDQPLEHTFVLDQEFWAGGVRRYLLATHPAFDHCVETESIPVEQVCERLASALRTNRVHCRPVPMDLRRHHRLLESLLPEPIPLPSLEDSADTPLRGRLRVVELQISERMRGLGYDLTAAARMLWRDFVSAAASPDVEVPGAFAAAVHHVVAQISDLEDLTLEGLADDYQVSVFDVSECTQRLLGTLRNARPANSYAPGPIYAFDPQWPMQ